ncbi:MAG: hypothetical protein QM766_27985 [Burkholderiaceae bacterium]
MDPIAEPMRSLIARSLRLAFGLACGAACAVAAIGRDAADSPPPSASMPSTASTSAASTAPPPEVPATQARIEQGGIALTVTLTPAANEPRGEAGRYRARLAFTDAASDAALSGLHPAAWLQRVRSPAELEVPCEDRARLFAAGTLGARADVDLNAYRLVSLNQDHSLHFINPFVRIRNSRLEATVALSGNGHDWTHDADAQRLAVTLRDEGRVALIDALTQRLAGEVDLGGGSRPTRLLPQPGGRVWVGLDGVGELSLIDVVGLREQARVPLAETGASPDAAGPITLAQVPGRPWLVAALAGESSAVLVDTDRARVLGRLPVPAGPVAVSYSAAAERILVLSGRAGVLSLLSATDQGLRAEGSLPVGAGALTVAPLRDGRFALVSNVQRHEVLLVDLARPAVIDRAQVPEWPDQIVATRDFAYVRSQASNRVTMFSIDALRAGRLEPVAIPIGQASASRMPQALSPAASMVEAPEGNGIWAAVAADAQIYRYAEGLMVPSGSLDNYRRHARALRVLDESLRETTTGRFEAPLRVDRGGRHVLIVRNGSPSFTACTTVSLPELPVADTPAPSPSRPHLAGWRQDGNALTVELRWDDAPTPPGARIDDLQAMLVGPRVAWQRRAMLVQQGPGRWQARLQLPDAADAARATLLVQSPRLGLRFSDLNLGPLDAAHGQPGDRDDRAR